MKDVPIGTVVNYEISGSAADNYNTYKITGSQKYTVMSKTSTTITFKIDGTQYLVDSYGRKTVLSQDNGTIKTWDINGSEGPFETGQLSTAFGVRDVKIFDFELPDNSAGHIIRDLGSSQYKDVETGWWICQSMNYSDDTAGAVFKTTKNIVSFDYP